MESARQTALKLLLLVGTGQSSKEALDEVLEQATHLEPRDRAFVQELSFGVLRWQRLLDEVIKTLSKKSPKNLPAEMLNVVRLGLYQIFFTRVPNWAAVNESVKLIKESPQPGTAGYVNALLREAAVDKGKILKRNWSSTPTEDLAIRYSHPSWLVSEWVETYGTKEAEKLCFVNNERPRICLRVNSLRSNREELKEKFKDFKLEETVHSPFGLQGRIPDPKSLSEFKKGLFTIQEEASQLVGLALSPVAKERILDCCAAPGGKATHIAELMGDKGIVVASDSDDLRLSKIKENVKRLKLKSIQVEKHDATHAHRENFDRILVDAPCSGWGVMRRIPESRWQKDKESQIRFIELQRKILLNAITSLKKGGTLVYSVCTFAYEECEEIIDFIRGREPTLAVEKLNDILPSSCAPFITRQGYFKTLPQAHGMDGFFIVRLIKK